MEDARLDEIARRLGTSDLQQKLELLANPVVRALARGLGIDLAEIDQQLAGVQASIVTILEAATVFGPFGWAVSATSLRLTDYERALDVWRTTRDRAAVDDVLARAWSEPVWLRHAYGPMTTLAGAHAPTRSTLLDRNRLMDRAVAHHLAEEFEASTLIVLTQIDGLTFDLTDGKFGFFHDAHDRLFEDAETLAGMPEFLRQVRRAVNRDVRATSDSDEFLRNAIVHGRALGFGTRANSAKAFALMGAVVEWLKPRAAALVEQRLDRDASLGLPEPD